MPPQNGPSDPPRTPQQGRTVKRPRPSPQGPHEDASPYRGERNALKTEYLEVYTMAIINEENARIAFALSRCIISHFEQV